MLLTGYSWRRSFFDLWLQYLIAGCVLAPFGAAYVALTRAGANANFALTGCLAGGVIVAFFVRKRAIQPKVLATNQPYFDAQFGVVSQSATTLLQGFDIMTTSLGGGLRATGERQQGTLVPSLIEYACAGVTVQTVAESLWSVKRSPLRTIMGHRGRQGIETTMFEPKLRLRGLSTMGEIRGDRQTTGPQGAA